MAFAQRSGLSFWEHCHIQRQVFNKKLENSNSNHHARSFEERLISFDTYIHIHVFFLISDFLTKQRTNLRIESVSRKLLENTTYWLWTTKLRIKYIQQFYLLLSVPYWFLFNTHYLWIQIDRFILEITGTYSNLVTQRMLPERLELPVYWNTVYNVVNVVLESDVVL